jgi:hypothetical protein
MTLVSVGIARGATSHPSMAATPAATMASRAGLPRSSTLADDLRSSFRALFFAVGRPLGLHHQTV